MTRVVLVRLAWMVPILLGVSLWGVGQGYSLPKTGYKLNILCVASPSSGREDVWQIDRRIHRYAVVPRVLTGQRTARPRVASL